MKVLIQLFCILVIGFNYNQVTIAQGVFSDDVDRFWLAYDKIVSISDSAAQYRIIQTDYIDRGTPGLRAIMEKRGYNAQSYIEAINTSPLFWNSIRDNTLRSVTYAEKIGESISKLELLYPTLRPAQVYFTIGAMYTGGTAHNGHVLIGAEIAMADSLVVTSDIDPDWLQENLSNYFQTNPIDDIVLLNVHEYVHTQQGAYGTDLLSMSIFEGVAEFVSMLAVEEESAVPAIPFGRANKDWIRQRFQKEMFSPNWNDWLYNNRDNEFEVRDLGYYVGYAICEGYYNKAVDKLEAIKDMIELDCTDQVKIEKFVKSSGYLTADYDRLKSAYKKNKPVVQGVIEPSVTTRLDPQTKTLSLLFSKPMNTRFQNFKIGPLGRDHLLPVTSSRWSDDRTILVLDVDLEPGYHYQLVVSSEFRDMDGRAIEEYLINLKTK